jgi:membrane-associated phospholipid phosphatase
MSAERPAEVVDFCPRTHTFRLPSHTLFLTFLREAIGITCLWLIAYGGANWVTSLHGHRVEMRTKLDSAFPFTPAAAILYLSLFPMLWLSPFILTSPGQVRRFSRSLATIILISVIGFVFVPAEAIDAVTAASWPFNNLFQLADAINLTHNYFPSLHVGMAAVCAVFYCRSVRPVAAILYCFWAMLIALSTLLTRQHYVVDVVAGGVLGVCVAAPLTANSPSWRRRGRTSESDRCGDLS